MADLLDPPKKIVLYDDPWLQAHTRKHKEWTTALSNLLPGSRPKNLSKSDYYLQQMKPGIEAGWCLDKCVTVCSLIDSIIKHGIRQTQETGWNPTVFHSVNTWVGPVGVAVGSDGGMHFWDGHHRKAICWLLGIPLPAFIIAVNSKWKELWEGDTHYDFYPHPYVCDTATVRRNSRLRFQRVIEWFRGKGVKSVVDIGSHHGHFPMLSAKAGMDVQSIEIDEKKLELGRCWYLAEQVQVKQFRTLQSKTQEAITCFNALHHIAKTRSDIDSTLSSFMAHRVIVLELSNDDVWWKTDISHGRTLSERILSSNGYSHQTIYCDKESQRLTVVYYK